MSSTPDSSLLLLGLTGSGKTNFLVALDVILENQDSADGLKHADLAPDRSYLHPLKEQWLNGQVLQRTNQQQPPPPHQLLLVHQATGRAIGLAIPDLAGETFAGQFVTRSIPQDLWERIEKADGLLLFVHCNQNADHAILEDPGLMYPIAPPAPPAPSETAPAPAGTTEPANEWKLEDACHQVKLVDLLQFLSERPHNGKALRLAVMISAWDLVEKAHAEKSPLAKELPIDPEEFLAKHWPLLKQFLDNNSDQFVTRVFGVSARGGGDSADESKRLTAIDCASDRVTLRDGNDVSHDLTRPIRWLLGIA